MNISIARSRSRRAFGWRWPKNCARAKAAPSIAGAPAASCCNFCPRRRSARASPISIPAMRRKAPRRTPCRKTMPGWKAALCRDRRGCRIDRSCVSSEQLVYRLFHEPGVRVFRAHRVARAMLVLARQCRGHVQKLFAGRPRSHGRRRQDFRHLRVLQRELCVRARARSRRNRANCMRRASSWRSSALYRTHSLALAQSVPRTAAFRDAQAGAGRAPIQMTFTSTTATMQRYERASPHGAVASGRRPGHGR